MKFVILLALVYFSYRVLFSSNSQNIKGKEKDKEIEYIDYEEIKDDE